MAHIGVIGWGIVGQAIGKGFETNPSNTVYWYDKFKKSPFTFSQVLDKSEFIFICVPTPMYDDYSGIDLSIMKSVIRDVAKYVQNTSKIIIIKSTVIPGTTESFIKKYPDVLFAMNPEFLNETTAFRDFTNPDRIVIGSNNEDVCKRIAILYRSFNGYEVPIHITDATTAEFVKYMANTFMATKIIFSNEMADLAHKLGVNYDQTVKMVAGDPRINQSFLYVTPFRGFGGKCFPKDTVALLGLARTLNVDLSLLNTVWKKNLVIRKVRDWEGIQGAVGKKNKK